MAAPGAPGMEQGLGMAGAAPPPGSYDEYKEQIKTVAQTSLSELLQMIPQKAAELFEAHKENIYLSEPPPSTFDQVFGPSDPESRKRRVRAKFINKITDQLTQELIGKNIEQASAQLRAAQQAEVDGVTFAEFIQERKKLATPQTRADAEKKADNERQAKRDEEDAKYRSAQLAHQAETTKRLEGAATREETKAKKQEIKDKIADLDKEIKKVEDLLGDVSKESVKGGVLSRKAENEKERTAVSNIYNEAARSRFRDFGFSGAPSARAKLKELQDKREALKKKLGGETEEEVPSPLASHGPAGGAKKIGKVGTVVSRS